MTRTRTGARWCAAGALALACGLAAAGKKADGPPPARRGRVPAVRAAEGPPIDGTLNSPLWRKCPPLALGECTAERAGALKTTARVLFAPTRLYVAFDCAEANTDALKQNVSRRDGPVWQDDCVELFVSGDTREGYFHFAVNPAGALMDARRRPPGKEDTSWDSTAAVKTSVVKGKRWIVTMSIPLKELGAYVGEDQTWVLNLNRTRPAGAGRPAAESSWAVMGSNDYHQVRDYGRITGVRIERREDGVTRQAAAPASPPPTYERGTPSGGVTIYRRAAEMTLRDSGTGTNKQIDLLIRNSDGLKVAFLARGSGGVKTAQFNMFDERARDNTTSDAYRLVDERWRPILYRCDRFFYNDGMNRRVARATSYRNLRFHGNRTPGAKGVLEIRAFTIYRGDDKVPPTAPTALSAQETDAGLRLSWKAAGDNVGTALYAVSRAAGEGEFRKVGRTCEPHFLDTPPKAGAYRYRVLAVDFQDNVGPWSKGLRVKTARAYSARGATADETAREAWAARVRETHARGAGKVVGGRVLCFGDSITGATNYRRYVESALGRYDVWARGYPAQRTSFARRKIDEDLAAVNPEFCLILYGTNNSKSAKALPAAMDDLRAVAASCEKRGTVAIIGTIPPRGFKDPASAPEARFNEALRAMCRQNRIPVASVFEAFLASEKTQDRRTLLARDGVHYIAGGWKVTAAAWKEAMDRVNFVLLDRPGT